MQRHFPNNPTASLRSLHRTCVHLLLAGALFVLSVFGNGAACAALPTPPAKINIARTHLKVDGRLPADLFGEEGERLLRAVERLLRTLAQNRSVCLTNHQQSQRPV